LYFGLIRRHVPDRREEVDLPEGSTVGDLLGALRERHGIEFHEQIVAGDGSVRDEVFITVDGSNVLALNGLDSPLAPETDLHIVLIGPIVTGGSALRMAGHGNTLR
jgi:hypothetical protein